MVYKVLWLGTIPNYLLKLGLRTEMLIGKDHFEWLHIIERQFFPHATCFNLTIFHLLSLLFFKKKKTYPINEKNTQNHRYPLQIILGLPHFTKELGQKLTITSPKQKPKICPIQIVGLNPFIGRPDLSKSGYWWTVLSIG